MLQYPTEQRRGYLFNKFNAISSQAQYPIRFDNERKWIRYYDKINNNRKKYRFNRYSLNMLDGSTMTGSMGLPSSQSFVSSPHIVENKMALTHSTFFHWFFVMFHYHFNKDRNITLIQFYDFSVWALDRLFSLSFIEFMMRILLESFFKLSIFFFIVIFYRAFILFIWFFWNYVMNSFNFGSYACFKGSSILKLRRFIVFIREGGTISVFILVDSADFRIFYWLSIYLRVIP